jgi:uncharacterized protein Veg
VTFTHRFATDAETVYFAFTFPYSFSDILTRTNELQMQAGLCSRDGGV